MTDESFPLGAGYTAEPLRLAKATVTITREEIMMRMRQHNKMTYDGYVTELFTQFVHGVLSRSFGIKNHVTLDGFIVVDKFEDRHG